MPVRTALTWSVNTINVLDVNLVNSVRVHQLEGIRNVKNINLIRNSCQFPPLQVIGAISVCFPFPVFICNADSVEKS